MALSLKKLPLAASIGRARELLSTREEQLLPGNPATWMDPDSITKVSASNSRISRCMLLYWRSTRPPVAHMQLKFVLPSTLSVCVGIIDTEVHHDAELQANVTLVPVPDAATKHQRPSSGCS